MYKIVSLFTLVLGLLFPAVAFADEAQLNGANTSWILTSTALVLLMTLPGLALFYGGLVRKKNVLSILMQCFSIGSISSILWVVVGYSLAFGEGNGFKIPPGSSFWFTGLSSPGIINWTLPSV